MTLLWWRGVFKCERKMIRFCHRLCPCTRQPITVFKILATGPSEIRPVFSQKSSTFSQKSSTVWTAASTLQGWGGCLCFPDMWQSECGNGHITGLVQHVSTLFLFFFNNFFEAFFNKLQHCQKTILILSKGTSEFQHPTRAFRRTHTCFPL